MSQDSLVQWWLQRQVEASVYDVRVYNTQLVCFPVPAHTRADAEIVHYETCQRAIDWAMKRADEARAQGIQPPDLVIGAFTLPRRS